MYQTAILCYTPITHTSVNFYYNNMYNCSVRVSLYLIKSQTMMTFGGHEALGTK
jgi:hypothetical protein